MKKLLAIIVRAILLCNYVQGDYVSQKDLQREHIESGTRVTENLLGSHGRLRAYTWGIGGARVARPSNPSATPPNIVEVPSKFSSRDIIHLSFSGHSAFEEEITHLLIEATNKFAGV